MKNDKIIPGTVLVLIGATILLHNYDVIHFHLGNFFHLWPIFFVVGGINLIFANNRSGWATALKLAVIFIGFGLIIFGNFGRRSEFFPTYTWYDDGDDSSSHGHITKVSGNSEFNTPYVANAKVATLNISGGGTVYTLNDTTSELFTASTKEFRGRYEFSHTNTDSAYTLNFKMRGNRNFKFDFNDDDDKGKGKDSIHTNSAVFKLNANPEWNINVKTGATELDFDLSKFKVRSVNLAGGAAEFNLKMGQPLVATNIVVETGMSDVTISVPATAACQIKSSTGLSSTNFDGFNKMADGTYETPGFSNAKNKMFIKMSGGMADFKVKRY